LSGLSISSGTEGAQGTGGTLPGDTLVQLPYFFNPFADEPAVFIVRVVLV